MACPRATFVQDRLTFFASAESTVLAAFFVAYACGNLIGPQTFRSKDAPRYAPALATSVALICFCIVDLALIWFITARRNRKRDEIMSSPDYVARENVEFLDETDLCVLLPSPPSMTPAAGSFSILRVADVPRIALTLSIALYSENVAFRYVS